MGSPVYEFLDRLISIALPRIRDFRGVNPNSFDGQGNYSLGLAEQVVFAEIDADRIHHTHGMDITIVTSAKNDDQARIELLKQFGIPFRVPTPGGPELTPTHRPTDSMSIPRYRMVNRHVDQGPDDQVADPSQIRGPASESLQTLWRPRASTVNSASAGSASRPGQLRGLIPGVKKASW